MTATELPDDFVFPEQFYETTNAAAAPVRGLFLALLVEAWRTLKIHDCAVRREAVAWFLAEGSDDLFSFLSVCTVLGLAADRVRAHVLQSKLTFRPPRVDRGNRRQPLGLVRPRKRHG